MKRIMLQLTAGVLMLLATTGLTAAQDTAMSFKVPFDFYVGEQLLPAGEYTVKRIVPGVLVLRITSKNQNAITINIIPILGKSSAKERLTFNRYENDYFLSELWWPGADIGSALVKGKIETRIAKSIHAIPRTVGSHN